MTYTSCKKHCNLYTEIHGLILINTCEIGIARKDLVLISDTAVIANGVASRTGVKDSRHMKFTLSAGTYSIDDIKTKIKAAVLQQRSDWKAPRFKYLNLVIPDH